MPSPNWYDYYIRNMTPIEEKARRREERLQNKHQILKGLMFSLPVVLLMLVPLASYFTLTSDTNIRRTASSRSTETIAWPPQPTDTWTNQSATVKPHRHGHPTVTTTDSTHDYFAEFTIAQEEQTDRGRAGIPYTTTTAVHVPVTLDHSKSRKDDFVKSTTATVMQLTKHNVASSTIGIAVRGVGEADGLFHDRRTTPKEADDRLSATATTRQSSAPSEASSRRRRSRRYYITLTRNPYTSNPTKHRSTPTTSPFRPRRPRITRRDISIATVAEYDDTDSQSSTTNTAHSLPEAASLQTKVHTTATVAVVTLATMLTRRRVHRRRPMRIAEETEGISEVTETRATNDQAVSTEAASLTTEHTTEHATTEALDDANDQLHSESSIHRPKPETILLTSSLTEQTQYTPSTATTAISPSTNRETNTYQLPGIARRFPENRDRRRVRRHRRRRSTTEEAGEQTTTEISPFDFNLAMKGKDRSRVGWRRRRRSTSEKADEQTTTEISPFDFNLAMKGKDRRRVNWHRRRQSTTEADEETTTNISPFDFNFPMKGKHVIAQEDFPTTRRNLGRRIIFRPTGVESTPGSHLAMEGKTSAGTHDYLDIIGYFLVPGRTTAHVLPGTKMTASQGTGEHDLYGDEDLGREQVHYW
ncbi:uncharacterized protein LOC135397341 isoform X2 [Ornithodoros turicata]|uniref:uncharacterized protein LOC135397341 isoform X2 n=1 Tax=Ornithodoros turicata TaxID=34597 RepID=UPI003138CB16